MVISNNIIYRIDYSTLFTPVRPNYKTTVINVVAQLRRLVTSLAVEQLLQRYSRVPNTTDNYKSTNLFSVIN